MSRRTGSHVLSFVVAIVMFLQPVAGIAKGPGTDRRSPIALPMAPRLAFASADAEKAATQPSTDAGSKAASSATPASTSTSAGTARRTRVSYTSVDISSLLNQLDTKIKNAKANVQTDQSIEEIAAEINGNSALVLFRTDTTKEQALAILDACGMRSVGTFGDSGLYMTTPKDGVTMDAALKKLQARPEVVAADSLNSTANLSGSPANEDTEAADDSDSDSSATDTTDQTADTDTDASEATDTEDTSTDTTAEEPDPDAAQVDEGAADPNATDSDVADDASATDADATDVGDTAPVEEAAPADPTETGSDESVSAQEPVAEEVAGSEAAQDSEADASGAEEPAVEEPSADEPAAEPEPAPCVTGGVDPSGHVTDKATSQPLRNARVEVTNSSSGAKQSAATDETGYYSILVPDGEYLISALSPGYGPITVTRTVAGVPITVDFELTDIMAPRFVSQSGKPINAGTVGQLPLIGAVFWDEESGIDAPTGVVLFLDGIDVTADAIKGPLSLKYRPKTPLAPGTHTVELTVRDRTGNEATSTWSFTVVASSVGDLGAGDFSGSASDVIWDADIGGLRLALHDVLSSADAALGMSYGLSAEPTVDPDTGAEFTDGDDATLLGYDVAAQSTTTVELTLDLGAVVRLGKASLTTGDGGATFAADTLEVLASLDGLAFTPVGSTATLEQGAMSVAFASPVEARYVLFRAEKTAGESAAVLQLNEGRVYEVLQRYATSGWYESRAIDTGAPSEFFTVDWGPVAQTGGTEIAIQVAGLDYADEAPGWVGPDGTSGTYFVATSTRDLPATLSGKRYIRYRLLLSTTDPERTPELSRVEFTYDNRGPPSDGPTVVFSTPAEGASLQGSEVAIAGTAADESDSVLGVFVSSNGGWSWQPAATTDGYATWARTLPAGDAGSYELTATAVDSEFDRATTDASVTVTVTPAAAEPAPDPISYGPPEVDPIYSGTGGDDTIYVEFSGGSLKVWINHDHTTDSPDFTDTPPGGGAGYTIQGGNGNDTITLVSVGSAPFPPSTITLDGGAGNDILNASGWQGDVTLIGGTGNDTMTGGSGNDIFVFVGGGPATPFGHDVVVELAGGTNDRLDFTGYTGVITPSVDGSGNLTLTGENDGNGGVPEYVSIGAPSVLQLEGVDGLNALLENAVRQALLAGFRSLVTWASGLLNSGDLAAVMPIIAGGNIPPTLANALDLVNVLEKLLVQARAQLDPTINTAALTLTQLKNALTGATSVDRYGMGVLGERFIDGTLLSSVASQTITFTLSATLHYANAGVNVVRSETFSLSLDGTPSLSEILDPNNGLNALLGAKYVSQDESTSWAQLVHFAQTSDGRLVADVLTTDVADRTHYPQDSTAKLTAFTFNPAAGAAQTLMGLASSTSADLTKTLDLGHDRNGNLNLTLTATPQYSFSAGKLVLGLSLGIDATAGVQFWIDLGHDFSDINGVSFSASAQLPLNLTFSSLFGLTLALDSSPSVSDFSATISKLDISGSTTPAISADLTVGFLGAHVTGTINLVAGVAWTGSAMSIASFASNVGTLVTPKAGADLDVSLTASVTAGLKNGDGTPYSPASATVTLTNADPFDPSTYEFSDFTISTDFSNLFDFNSLTAADVPALLRRLASTIESLGNTSVFSQFKIPFIASTIDNLLDFLDGISDRLLVDDLDDTDPSNDIGHLLSATGGLNFTDAQSLATQLASVLGLSASDINATYDSTAKELLFTINLSAELVLLEFPIDFKFDLSPLASISSQTRVVMTASAGIHLTFGFDVSPWTPPTDGTARMDAFLSRFFVRGVTGDDIFATLSLRPAWLMNDCLIDAADNKILYVSPSIPVATGLQVLVKPRPGFTPGNYTIQSVGASLVNISGKNYQKLTMNAAVGTVGATGGICVLTKGVEATANFSIVSITLKSPTGAETDGVSVGLGVDLKDPDNTDGKNRITLLDIKNALGTPSSVLTDITWNGIDVNDRIRLEITVSPNFSDFTVAPGGAQIALTVVQDALSPTGFKVNLPDPSTLLAAIGNLGNFPTDFSIGDVIAGLKALASFLGQFESFGFLNTDIPLIGKSINDLIGFATKFVNALNAAQANPASSLQTIESMIVDALGLPVLGYTDPGPTYLSTNSLRVSASGDFTKQIAVGSRYVGDGGTSRVRNVTYDSGTNKTTVVLADSILNTAHASVLTVFTPDFLNFQLVDGPSSTKILRMDLYIAKSVNLSTNLSLPAGSLGPLALTGQAGLALEAQLVGQLAFGISLATPGDIYLFDDTKLSAWVKASGSNLTFAASLGPLSLGIENGNAMLTASASAGIKASKFTDHKVLLSTLVSDILDAVDLSVTGSANATLTVKFSGFEIGDLVVSISDLTNPTIDVSGTAFDKLTDPDVFASLLQSFSFFDSLKLIAGGVDSFLDMLQGFVSGNFAQTALPFLGDQLSNAAQFINDFRRDFVQPFQDAIEKIKNAAADFTDNNKNLICLGLYDLLGPSGLNLLRDGPDAGANVNVTDIVLDTNFNPNNMPSFSDIYMQWVMDLGGTYVVSKGIDFDLAIPGLGISTAGSITLSLQWSLMLGFGLSGDKGFYLVDIQGRPELAVDARIDLDDATITGKLAFLELQAKNEDVDDVAGASIFGIQFGMDVTGNSSLVAGTSGLPVADQVHAFGIGDLGSLDLEVTAAAVAHAELGLTLGILSANTGFPTLKAGFLLDFGFGTLDTSYDPLNPDFDSLLTNSTRESFGDIDWADALHHVGFVNIRLDLGTFISNLIGPTLGKIADAISPLNDIISIMTAPIPVISTLAGHDISLVDLAELFGDVDLGWIDSVAEITGFISTLSGFISDTNDPLEIPFGDFDIYGSGTSPIWEVGNFTNDILDTAPSDPWTDFGSVLSGLSGQPAAKSAMENLNNAANEDAYGFSFPLFDHPSDIFKLLMGKDIRLVEYNMKPFYFDFSYSQFFPIMGPLGASITGEVGIQVQIGFGYGTRGIREFVESDFKNWAALFNGFYLTDTDPVTGNDVAELKVWGGISAAAVCNLVVAEIGVAGGIFLTINFNLDDPDNDGVVYLEEMAENIYLNDNFGIGGGPLAIFDIYGDLSVRLWAFIKVDLFFFSINWELDIVPMTPLVTFSVDFYRGPQLAQTFAGGSTDLILNVGPAASQRVRGDLNGDAAETVIVTQGGDATHVNVTQNGVTQEYEVTGTIYAKGGGGDDVIDLSGVTANIPVVIDGGPGNDTIKAPSGSGVAILTGGPGNDTIVGGGGDDQIWGNEGDDIISDPGGNNIIFGDDGKVAYDSGTGKYSVDVVVNNADGSDTITGGPNSDAIFGAGGKDSINGGAGDDVIFGDTGSVVFKFGSITIYSVTNTEVSKAGDADTLTGGTGTDYIFGGVGNDIIDGGPDRDFLFGESGFDEIHGGGGNDDIFGDGWVLRNDPNHPYRPASGGDSDKIWGDAGDDYIWAGAGDDVVEGGADDDYLYGGPGADVLWGDGQNPAAGDGMDHLYGQTDNDKLYGGDEVDVLDGGEGDDILFGAFGVNSYESLSDGQKRESEILPNKIVPSDPSRDQDTLYWFAGADLLDGQGGSDHYILDFRGGQATAHVWVFDSGQTADGNDTMEVDGTAFDDIFLLRAVADVDGLAFVAMLNKQAEGDDKVERADYDNIEKLTVNGQVGNDKFFVDDSHAQTTLNGGAGQDTFQLGQLYRSDRIYPNVSDETQFVTPIYLQPVYADPFPRNGTDPYLYLGGDQFATVETTRGFLSNGNSVAPTTVNGGPGNDFFTVYHNQQVANLNGEAGDDTFLIKAFALAGSQQPKRGRTDVSGGDGTDLVQYVVNAPVNIDGGDGFDTVIVVGTEFGDDIVITKDGVYGAGLNVNFVNIESLQVDGAEGDDRFYVQSTSEKFVTRISGGLGNDTFTMAGDVPPIISNTLLGHSGIITHSIENGDGAAYNADLKIIGISANVADNEEPAIRITQTAGVTSVIEGSSTPDSYTIVLTREPTTDVIVRCLIPDRTPTNEEMGERSFRVDSSAPGALVEQDGSGVILTFKATGAQKWDIPQQVDVYANISGPIADPLTVNYDDTAYEGERYGFINHTVEQETGSYRGGVTDLSVASFPDPIQDWPPKLRYETTLTLSHDHLLNGDPLPYPFVAHELIGATLELVAGQGIGQRMLIKDNTADTVTLFGKFRPGREPATDGTSLYLIRRYHYLALPSVLVQVHDNDSADVAISQVGPISNDVDNLTDVVEGGATDRIAVRLCKEPTQQVQIQLHSTTGQVSFSSSVLTFNTGPGWDTPQYVTITAVNDSVKEGFHHDAITFEVIAGEGDGTGNQTDKFELTETPEDPDVIFAADVVERPDAFIGLSHLPKNGVVTSVTVTDKDGTRALTAGTDYYIESNLIVFLDADGQPKTLTAEITVVYDYVKPGYHPPSPNKLAIDTVLVDIADNEVAGVIITQTGGSTNVIETPTHEGDGVPWTDTYTVALSKAPVDDVYITITPQITKTTRGRIRWDLPQVKVSSTAAGSTHETRTLPNPNGGSEDEPSSFDVEVVILKFTTSNWATPQEVTVTARDDDGLPTMNSTGTVGVVDGGDTHVFAPSLHTVTDIQGPVFIEGAGGSGSLVSRNATMLPGERNVKEPASNVVAYSTTPELTTITVNRDDAMGFLVDFEEITDVTDNPQKLVNHTLEITSGSAIDQFRLIMVVEVDPSNSDNLVLTLNAPYILDAGDVIDTSTKYAVTRESLSFFVDESKCIDFMFVYDDDSPADSSGKIDILSTDDYPNNSTVAQFVTQMDARHLTGLLMGADLTIGGFLQPGGITYAGLEVVEINLGPGDNTFDIAHTHYRTDFQTWTMVNTGGGDDHVTVSISRTRYSDVAVAGSVGDSHSATPQIQITPPAGVTFATDELRGFVVEIKRGDDVFARREILHNTADTFTLSAPWDLDKDGNPLPAMAGDIATFWLEDGPLAVNGQTGDDEIDGSASTIPLVLFGSEGDDTLSGGSADDIIFGDLGRVDYYDEAGRLVTRLGVDRAEKVGFITAASNGVTAPADPSEWTAYVSLTDLDGNDPFTDDWYDDLILTGTEFQTVNGPGFGQFLYVLSYTADSLVLRGNFDPIPYDPLNQSTWRIPILPENQTDGVVRAPTLAMCRDRSVGGTDIILGRAGDDLIFGGAASDIIAGDSGATNPDDGDDIILGDNGRADWSLAGSPYDSDPDTIDRVRTLDPSYGDIDLIYGDGANDLIVGGTAGDFIFSGTGNDLVFGDFADVKFGTVSLTMSAAVLMKQYPLYATVTDDDLGGIDVIWGGDDEDVIVGGAYGDYLDGGMDDDLIFGDNVTLDRITTYNDFTNPRFRTVDGAMYGTNPATNDGQAIVGTTPQNIPALTGTPAWGNWDITLLHHEAPAPTPATLYGDDYIAGGGGDDEIFGQLGDDTIQGDGGIGDSWSGGDKVDAYRDGSGVLHITSSVEAATDGDDYIEGNGGADVIFGNLGQDDIIGGNSSLFSLNTPARRPDAADMLFGGAGNRATRNLYVGSNFGTSNDDPQIALVDRHARDADTIAGDNANIYRIVSVAAGAFGGMVSTYRTFNYDVSTTTDPRGTLRVIPHAVGYLDYTPGGPDYVSTSMTADIGGADEIHGESGDDTIYGFRDDDVLFGDSDDDDIIGGWGNDWISGGTGQDGILGDDGRISTSRNSSTYGEPLYGVAVLLASDPDTKATNGNVLNEFIYTPGKVQTATINVADMLKKSVNLTPFNVDPAGASGGIQDVLFRPTHSDDIIYGGLGSDFLHGGSGDDAISGAEALPNFFNTPSNPGNVLQYNATTTTFAAYDEYDPWSKVVGFLLNFDKTEGPAVVDATWGTAHTDGDDEVFGDLGNDWLVGGTGKDDIYGGWGDDLLQADDDLDTNSGANNAPDTHPSYEDRAYGGAGRDVLIANTGGDRLIDWVGEFNSYIVPFAPFGIATVSRTVQPQLPEFLYGLSGSDGADPTRAADTGADPTRNGEPEGELGLVLQKDPAWQDQTGGPRDPQAGNIPGGPRDVLRSASFNNGQAQGFSADSGLWSVSNGRLEVAPEVLGGDAASVFYVDSYLPRYYEVVATINAAKPIKGYKSNAYLIFDYESATNFKFAGIDISTDKLVMGHYDATGWHVDVQTPAQLKPETDYQVLLSVNGTYVTVVVNGTMAFAYTFAPRVDADGYVHMLNEGMVGIGANNSKARIDNVAVQVLPPNITFSKTADFSSAPTELLGSAESGTWTLSGGRYVANSAGGLAIDTSRVRVSASYVLTADATLAVSSGSAGFVFDSYGVDNFKFATVSASGAIVIGHYTRKTGWVIDATASAALVPGVDVKLGIKVQGNVVTLTLNGVQVLTKTYYALVSDGGLGLFGKDGLASFDSLTIKTNDPAVMLTP